ncbi:hypothetical protein FA727_23635, partial [Robertmurraya kyonggiensis]
MLIPKRPEVGTWKMNVAKEQGVQKPKVTFDMLYDKYTKQKAVSSDRPLKKRMRSPIQNKRVPSPPRMKLDPVWDDNGVMWVPYHSNVQPSFHPGWEGPRRRVQDRIIYPRRDRLAFRQSGQERAQAVRPPVTGGQTARQGQPPRLPSRQVYRPKRKEEVQSMDVDSERTTEFDIIQVGTMDVPIEKSLAMKPTSSEKTVEDQGASTSKVQQRFLPRWCPEGLTRTQKRKLQRLRFRERQEQELEKQRDEFFNQSRPMIPQRKEWKPKEDPQVVQPAAQAVQTACHSESAAQAVRPPVQTVRPGDAEV